MSKIPIGLIIDDPAPIVNVYYEHSDPKVTKDGRALLPAAPVDFLRRFCDVAERYGLKGKFSIVPMPTGYGDIVNGIDGIPKALSDEWLTIARARLGGRFDFCPEILTHGRAVDLATENLLDLNEKHWAKTQDRETLAPYIARGVELLRDAGVAPTGVTSPWDFGIEVEGEYVAAISRAFREELGATDVWYFLHCRHGEPHRRPWIAYDEDGCRVVSIAATCGDHFWQTIDAADTSDEFVRRVADGLITEDGTSGELIEVLEKGCWPVLLTHWQSLFSNGNETGLRCLELVAARIEKNLGDKVEWHNMSQLMNLTLGKGGCA